MQHSICDRISVCSTLSGQVALKHPIHGILVREDGYVFRRMPRTNRRYWWTHGCINERGYPVTSIRYGDKNIPRTIHRMVAECFIPNPENKPTVDHENRDRTDNRVCNLRWATSHEQMLNTSKHYKAVEKWGFTPIDDAQRYKTVHERAYRQSKRERGLKRMKCPDGHYHWIRAFSSMSPMYKDEVPYRILENVELKIQLAKERKREYDKAYRALKGEERLRKKREYYYANRESILEKQRAKRHKKQEENL